MPLRPATEDDRDAVLALGVREEAAWFGTPEVDAVEVGEWIDEEGGVTPGVVALDARGEVAGFAYPGRRQAVFLAEPAHVDALTDELLPWLLQRRPELEVQTFGQDAARVAAFERHGLVHRRSSFSLTRPAEAGQVPRARFPESVEVAPYTLGEDDEAVHRMIYTDAAWGDVPGHTVRDLPAWQEVVRPAGTLFVARRGGRPVGWVAGRRLASGRGYVPQLAVAADERGRGLGRALLLHAFAALQEAGAEGLALDVEAENEGALALYRSVGLEVEREWRIYAAGGWS